MPPARQGGEIATKMFNTCIQAAGGSRGRRQQAPARRSMQVNHGCAHHMVAEVKEIHCRGVAGVAVSEPDACSSPVNLLAPQACSSPGGLLAPGVQRRPAGCRHRQRRRTAMLAELHKVAQLGAASHALNVLGVPEQVAHVVKRKDEARQERMQGKREKNVGQHLGRGPVAGRGQQQAGEAPVRTNTTSRRLRAAPSPAGAGSLHHRPPHQGGRLIAQCLHWWKHVAASGECDHGAASVRVGLVERALRQLRCGLRRRRCRLLLRCRLSWLRGGGTGRWRQAVAVAAAGPPATAGTLKDNNPGEAAGVRTSPVRGAHPAPAASPERPWRLAPEPPESKLKSPGAASGAGGAHRGERLGGALCGGLCVLPALQAFDWSKTSRLAAGRKVGKVGRLGQVRTGWLAREGRKARRVGSPGIQLGRSAN